MPRARNLATEKKIRGVYEHPVGSGVWWINVYVDGVRRREKVGRKSDAITLYQTRKTEARREGKFPELRRTRKVTLGDLVDLAIEYTANHKDARNYVSKGAIVKEQLGATAADELTPQQIEQWLSKHCKTAATANRYRAFLSLAYRVGMANGKVDKNPARLVRQRKENNARLRYLSREEYARLSDVLSEDEPQHLPAFIVSVHTGMRLSEQHTLTWGQVDLKRRVIRLSETKNGSARTVYLNADALAALQAVQTSGQKPSDLVFSSDSKRGDYETQDWFKPALNKAGVTGYTWHSNRHTFCSWLAMKGATIKEIQELAGHKTITMSARYAHLSPDHKLSVIERLSAQ
jgi:integrase